MNTQLLRAGTTRRLRLDLPGELSVTATRRTDLTRGAAAALGLPTAAARSASTQMFNASAAAGASIPASPAMFLGEVVGAKGFMSSVTLVVSESGAVHGNIRFWDKKHKQFRTFMVRQMITQSPLFSLWPGDPCVTNISLHEHMCALLQHTPFSLLLHKAFAQTPLNFWRHAVSCSFIRAQLFLTLERSLHRSARPQLCTQCTHVLQLLQVLLHALLFNK